MKLLVTLPPNRAYSGYFLATDDDGVLLASGRCLGKSDNGQAARHNNPDRDPTKEYGDTPTGDYHPTKAVMWAFENKFGKGWIPIDGATGQAMAAMEGGRSGLAIHAGRMYSDGRLTPTYGCVRVSTVDFDKIVAAAAGGEILVTVIEEQG